MQEVKHIELGWKEHLSLIDTYTKEFPNYLNNNKKVSVSIWKSRDLWDTRDTWSFTVHAGRNSDFTYTGFCTKCSTLDEAIAYVEELYAAQKLFR